MTQRPKTKLSATQHATSKLRESILSGDILPGARLVQEQLAETLGLSRVPIREALRILEAEGLVTHIRSAGYSVSKMDAQTLHRIQRMRRLLETDALLQAFELGALGSDLAAQLSLHLGDLRTLSPDNAAQMASRIRSFHFCIFDSCDDPILLRFLRNLWDATDSWRTIYYRTVFAMDAVQRERVFARYERLINQISQVELKETITMLDELREEGFLSAEQAVQALKEDNQRQAQLMLRALES
tara:strand:+ start:382 stop:1110 length:729 start_codon:yes stop_codon:yes gene_type:complete